MAKHRKPPPKKRTPAKPTRVPEASQPADTNADPVHIALHSVAKPHHGSHPTETGKPGSPVRHFLQGLAIVALLTLLKTTCLEPTTLGKQLEQFTVNLLQLRLADAADSRQNDLVQVVDISSLVQVSPRSGDSRENITPRDELAKVVEAVAQADPEAIGIDVYFEPDSQGQLTEDDQEFLEKCLALRGRNGQPIPVFVGIYGSVARGYKGWLGEERFGRLGAAIVIPNSEDKANPGGQLITSLEVEADGNRISAPSLSFALSQAGQQSQSRRRWFGRWMSQKAPGLVTSQIVAEEDGIRAYKFHIDFGVIGKLLDSRIPADTVANRVADLQGKIVLIGRGTPGQTSDMFNIPGQGASVPGVYVHAAAVDTLLQSPLFTLTPMGRVLADILAALIPLGFIFFLERFLQQTVAHEVIERTERWITSGMVVVILLLGYGWVSWSGIYWTDFVLVCMALLLHGPTEQLAKILFRE